MSTVAFVGLGIMGGPMASHLARAGHAVSGFNRTPEKAAALVAAGGRAADSIAEAVTGSDVVCVMVPDTPDVVDVLTGPRGVFDTAAPGTLVIDFSTIRPDTTVRLAHEAAERGLGLLDAPVSGGQAGARDATLSVMVGGAEPDFARALGVLETVGKTIVHVGPSGSGQTVKAANQHLVAAHIAALSEAILFLEASDVDLDAAVRALSGGLAGSRVLDAKYAAIAARSFEPGFRVDLHHKDLGIFVSAAREADLVVPLASLVAQLMSATRAQGDGQLDHSALFRTLQRLTGRTDATSCRSDVG